MKCPQCGMNNYVSEGSRGTTCMYHSPFIDENGKQHHHDANSGSTSYHCMKCSYTFRKTSIR